MESNPVASLEATAMLREVSTAEASPPVARIYERINALSGARMPALIYRTMATQPEALEWLWTAVGPALDDGWLQDCARRMMERLEVPVAAERGEPVQQPFGLDADSIDTVRTIVQTYNRVNPINLLIVKTALRLLDGPASASYDRAAAPLPPPLPAVPDPLALDAMTDDCRQAVLRLSAHVPDSSQGVLIPTLYRHLARWPTSFIEMAGPIERHLVDGTLQACAGRLIEEADRLALQFCSAVPTPAPIRPELADFIERVCDPFRITIPQLSAVGKMLERATEEPLECR